MTDAIRFGSRESAVLLGQGKCLEVILEQAENEAASKKKKFCELFDSSKLFEKFQKTMEALQARGINPESCRSHFACRRWCEDPKVRNDARLEYEAYNARLSADNAIQKKVNGLMERQMKCFEFMINESEKEGTTKEELVSLSLFLAFKFGVAADRLRRKETEKFERISQGLEVNSDSDSEKGTEKVECKRPELDSDSEQF